MSPLKVNELQALNEGIKVHSNFRTLIRYKKLKQNGDCMYKTGKINITNKNQVTCNEFSPFLLPMLGQPPPFLASVSPQILSLLELPGLWLPFSLLPFLYLVHSTQVQISPR